ncbi:MAG: NAD-dependent succinate-semialdehyde dehydrogenase [Bacteroidetes bacterium]|nr:MAG: NAD-dependent succinate-semialdehyde dehydrogenase [Bacteroidota bacterium]
MAFESRNPLTGEVYRNYPFDSSKAIREKIEKAQDAQRTWKQQSFAHRKECMLNLSKHILEQKLRLAEGITKEMGKPITEALAEVEKCALTARYYAEHAEAMLQSDFIEAKGRAEISYGPLGVIFGIFPWNYPLWQVFRFVIPSLMAGNAALFKHAENTPQCAVEIVHLVEKSGFSEGLVQHLFASLDSIEEIIANPAVKAVTLTGSEKAGSSVASLAGKYIKKVVLELGGSDPCIILPDADLKAAAKISALSRYQNTGQSCIAAKRFLVHDKVYDEFVSLFTTEAQKFIPANPAEAETNMGTLARKDLADIVMEQVEDALQHGAQLLFGGERLSDTQISPGVLIDINPASRVYKEELFGPIASFYRVKSEEEALLQANDSSYGLGASIWTQNTAKARALAEELECGMVYFNSMVKSTPELPFGGIKNSGIGRELSVLGIREFTTHKLIYPL